MEAISTISHDVGMCVFECVCVWHEMKVTDYLVKSKTWRFQLLLLNLHQFSSKWSHNASVCVNECWAKPVKVTHCTRVSVLTAESLLAPRPHTHPPANPRIDILNTLNVVSRSRHVAPSVFSLVSHHDSLTTTNPFTASARLKCLLHLHSKLWIQNLGTGSKTGACN